MLRAISFAALASLVERVRSLPRTVLALGWVSLFTDLSSEMIVPLLPAFVATLGAGPAFLGLLEGLSHLVVSVLRVVSGRLSDRLPRRKPWVLSGYGLSTVMRPLLAVAGSPPAVLAIRTCDRVGKGLRSAPRDAMVADVVESDRRGLAYGLQRAMDHAGAVLGPLVAFVLLSMALDLRAVFALAAIPGIVAISILWLGVREAPRVRESGPPPPRAARPEPGFRALLVVVAFAGFGPAVDLFFVWRAGELGFTTAEVCLLWVVLHLVRSGLATPLGALSDRAGRATVLAVGLTAQSFVLLGFGFAASTWHIWVLFALHGLHAAFNEGAERALVADLAGGDKRGFAFGVYHMVSGLAVLAAGLVLGQVYARSGATVAFAVGAGSCALAVAVLLTAVRRAATRAR